MNVCESPVGFPLRTLSSSSSLPSFRIVVCGAFCEMHRPYYLHMDPILEYSNILTTNRFQINEMTQHRQLVHHLEW
jgi:hypothetical protein